MFINGNSSTGPMRAGAAVSTARMDCLRLLHGQAKTSGGNAGNAGNAQSLGNGPLFDDGGKRRKPAEIGGNSVQGPAAGRKYAQAPGSRRRQPSDPGNRKCRIRACYHPERSKGPSLPPERPPSSFAQGRRYARGDSSYSPFSDRDVHCRVMPSPRRAVGDWQSACGNCGNSRDASRQGFVSALGSLQVGNRPAVAEIAEIGRRFLAPVRPWPRCLTGVGAAPILPHRKNGLKSRKHKAF